MCQEEFWDWSVRVYANPQTQNACLRLQDEFAQDVNALLWACWLGVQGKSPTPSALNTLGDISAYWQTALISGVRKARRSLQVETEISSAPDLKSAFLELELALEKQEQLALQALPTLVAASEFQTPSALCMHNIGCVVDARKQKECVSDASKNDTSWKDTCLKDTGWKDVANALIGSIL